MAWQYPNDMTGEHIAQQGGSYEPQRTNNFMLTIPNIPGDPTGQMFEFALEAGFAPNETQEPQEIAFQNEKYKVAGPISFEQGTVRYVDYVDPDVSGRLAQWRKMCYDADTGKVGLARDYKRNARLRMFGPAGGADKEWVMLGLWPSQVTWASSLDFASPEVNKIEVSFVYDKAKILNQGLRTTPLLQGYLAN